MRRAVMAIAVCLAALAAATGALAATAAKVSAPKSGTFTGSHGKLSLFVSGKSIDLAAFDFKCKATTGRTNINGIPLKRTRKGYTFSIKVRGSATYADDHPDQNGTIRFSGRFSRTGRSARGVLRVKTAHCGDSGNVSWTARR